jgi:hypothetical protein
VYVPAHAVTVPNTVHADADADVYVPPDATPDPDPDVYLPHADATAVEPASASSAEPDTKPVTHDADSGDLAAHTPGVDQR